MATDKKFLIAFIIIILLALALIYILLIGPRLQGFVVNKQVEAQQSLIRNMIAVANQQGYVTLQDGDKQLILVNSNLLKQQANQSAAAK